MAGSTLNRGYPYPTGTDANDVPYRMQALAEAIDVDMQGTRSAWTAYTPTIENWTLGTGGSVSGAFKQHGRTVHYRAILTLGTGFTTPGLLIVGIPRPIVVASQVLGWGVANDVSTTAAQAVMVRPWAGSTGRVDVAATGSGLTTGTPWAWATGDSVQWSGTYETSTIA